MERLKRSAIILSLIESLLENGSWCGETHIQKTTYFLQELLKVPLDLEFILYKHGPFSFDLSDELMAMRADMIVELQSRPPYGPSIVPGPTSGQLKRLFPKTLKKYEKKVKFIAKEMGGYNIAELERVATALYATLETQKTKHEGKSQIVSYITKIKPHISSDQASIAIEQEAKIRNKAKQLVQST
jgi:uncharacterized protein YwgA